VVIAGGRALPIQKFHQGAVMLGRDVDEASTGVPACGMDQRECAVDPALGFKLTLNLDPVSDRKEEIVKIWRPCVVRSTRVH